MGNHTEVNRAYKHFATQRKAVDNKYESFGSLYADKSELIEHFKYHPQWNKSLSSIIIDNPTPTKILQSEWAYIDELINYYKSLKIVISVNPWAFIGMSTGDNWHTSHPAYKLLNYFNHEDSFVVFGVAKDTLNDEIFTAPKKFVQLCYFDGIILEQHSVVPKNDVVNDIFSNAIENILFKNGCKTVTKNNTTEPFVGSCTITFKEEI